MGVELTKQEIEELAARCWRSPVEYCRVFHPTWFPSKMPWVHRGLAALRTGLTDFLLDFGPEVWPEGVESWTPTDLVKLVTNFVVEVKPAIKKEGVVIQPAVVEPIFVLDYDADGSIHGIRLNAVKKNTVFMLPRGYSKTTLINALNERDLNYGAEPFILYISETEGHADNQVMTVRRQLEENQLLRLVFGNQVPDRNSSLKWTDSEIELLNGTRLASLGTGGQVRGTSKDAQRPTLIVVDDFQDAEQCRNSETQRGKDLRWFVQVLMPARQLFGMKTSRMCMIGTMPHPEAVIAILMKDPDWTPVRFGALDRQNDPLWAYALDIEKLAKLRKSYEDKGMLDAFDYEYMSAVPINDGVAIPVDKIRVNIIRPSNWFVAKCVVADPAISENPKADFFSLACLGMSHNGDFNLIDFYMEVGVEFDEQSEKFFDMHFAHCLDLPPEQVKHGVESIAYQRALKSSIEDKQHRKSKTWGNRAFFEVTPIIHGRHEGSKIMRVQGILAPRIKSGHMEFSQPFPRLSSQLRDWGTENAKKDGPDVLAMGVALLDPFVGVISAPANDDEEEGIASRLFGGREWRKAP